MAGKYDLITELYKEISSDVSSSPQRWKEFLSCACRNFRLRFDEQLLVFAQKPTATAVLEIERWNKDFGRWVNRGATGIAVFADEDNSKQRITHYFDISDTHPSSNSRPVPLWEMKPEYTNEVIETLVSSFGTLEDTDNLAHSVIYASKNAMEDNVPDYVGDLIHTIDDSFLAEVSDERISQIYRKLVTGSVAYMVLSRLELSPDQYISYEALSDIRYFNTIESLNALGFATSDIAEMALSEISKTVLTLDRKNRTFAELGNGGYNVLIRDTANEERSNEDDRTELHDAGRLQTPDAFTPPTEGSFSRQIRNDEKEISEGAEEGPVLQPPDELPIGRASGRDRTDSDRVGRETDEGNVREAGSERGIEGNGYADLGTDDQQYQPLGTGDGESNGNIRLDDTVKLLPSVTEQSEILETKAEENKTSAFVVSQEDIDAVLVSGSGFSEGKFRIYFHYQEFHTLDEHADFLKKEYGQGGKTFVYPDGTKGSTSCDSKGIHIEKYGNFTKPDMVIPWKKVSKRLGELIKAERYLDEKEIEYIPTYREKLEARRVQLELQRERIEKLRELSDYASVPIEEKRDSLLDRLTTMLNYLEGYQEGIAADLGISHMINASKDAVTEYISDPKNRANMAEFTYRIARSTGDAHLRNAGYSISDELKDGLSWRYEYATGTTVYIGTDKFEVISVDDDRIMLFDEKYPMFTKEYTRETFEDILSSSSSNDGLKVLDLPEAQDTPKPTPYWDEYNEIKKENPDYIVIYQVGDFFEVMGDDAETVADALDLTLTRRTLGNGESVPMAGFPVFSAEAYIQKLTDKGYFLVVAPIENEERKEYTIVPEAKENMAEIAEIEITAPAFEKPKPSRVQSFDLYLDVPMSQRHNFDLANNEIEEVNKKERFHRNYAAIKVLKDCQREDRFATPDEQVILSKYVGWGGIPEAFDEGAGSWQNEYTMLKSILTEEEYTSARESTLTAFYTPTTVISAMYKAMEQMGFREGNILEPSCGIGHFIGMIPESMSNSRIYGVEMDSISAGIAQQLYQKTSITPEPFEEVNVPDSFFDAVVGNIPFGDFKVSDKRYDKHKFLIHDYFIAKSLDKLRPGGILALITSKGTMDKQNPTVRKYIAQRAELLGAIRLPNDTFKGNAGTEVVSDILFFQKRDRLIDIEPEWVHLDTDSNGFKMNSYFVSHHEMILGEMKTVSGRFGEEVTCAPYENSDLSVLLNEAIQNIHGEITEYALDEELDEQDDSIPADPTVRNFSYTIVDGKIYYRENSRMSPIEASATSENRIKGMIAIRDSVRTLIDLQTNDYSDTAIKEEQERLNSLYDSFTAKYGLINSRANTSAFSQDGSYSLLSALEILGDDGQLERKADMFFKRTIKPHIPVTSVDTATEALAVSMGEKACIDIEYMCSLCNKSEEEIYSELKGVIFLNPMYGYSDSTAPKYLMADEYLSGNVREKLVWARKSAELDPDSYRINVEALERVQPKDLGASEIAIRLGATWVPPEIFEQFMFEFLDTPRYAQWKMKVHFSQYTGEWNVENKNYDRGNIKSNSTYGTTRINAYKIIEETLNLKDIRIFDYVEDSEGKKKAVLNKQETAIAQSKQELIKQGFQDWVWADPTRRERLCRIYNERFNSIRPREYDGSHITFNGMNPEISLREHQRNAVARILYGGNTLLAHAVGAGKTFEMTAAAMESKRLGLCNKSLFVVPNHLTEQWAAEFLQLYPSANILVATKKDFETKNRKRFCGRIATGDYDAVIIGHSQFEKIPMSVERQRALLEQQIQEITDGISELKHNRGDSFSVKQLERSKKAIKAKLDKLNDQSRKDDVVTFEELGVDRIFVDESHYYKNLFLYTKMRNVGGIAQTEAQKSSDLFMKCRYLDEITGGRGNIFATGTPISNSMVELYTIQRYLQYNTLQRYGLQHFDSWASTFGETITAVELTPEGTGYRAKTRFAKFYNLPELMSMFKEVADIQTADMLNLPVPKANFHNIAVKPSEMQKEMVADLADRAERVRNGMVDSSVDNMLKITNDGRKLALDQRMINPLLPDFEGSKLNACVDNIYRIWEESKEKYSAQLFFCDLSTPKSDGTFSVYNDIQKKLIERGVPESEIMFIHDANTEVKKLETFKKTRRGEIRLLMGSTQKMGAGTNVQNKLIALHDLDCPWRPSDLEQRLGRIVRQGNENLEVDIFRYVTEETFDAYLYQLIEGKQKFSSQIFTSKSPVRACEDIDETALSYAEIKMLATGNPYIKEKMDLDIQVQKLRLLKSNFLSEKYALEDKILKYYPQEIARLNATIEGLKTDIACTEKHPKSTEDNFVGITIKGEFYSDKSAAGAELLYACKAMTSPDPIPIGEYRGFKMELQFDVFEKEYQLLLKGELSYLVHLGTDVHGNFTRMDNVLDSLPKRLSITTEELDNTHKQFELAKSDVDKPFAQEDELKEKTARLNELNALLNVDKRENEIVGGEVEEQNETPEIKTPTKTR